MYSEETMHMGKVAVALVQGEQHYIVIAYVKTLCYNSYVFVGFAKGCGVFSSFWLELRCFLGFWMILIFVENRAFQSRRGRQ